MSFVEAIARKRDRRALTRDQIAAFVRGASDGSLPPEQLAAMLMAICCCGMDAEGTPTGQCFVGVTFLFFE